MFFVKLVDFPVRWTFPLLISPLATMQCPVILVGLISSEWHSVLNQKPQRKNRTADIASKTFVGANVDLQRQTKFLSSTW